MHLLIEIGAFLIITAVVFYIAARELAETEEKARCMDEYMNERNKILEKKEETNDE